MKRRSNQNIRKVSAGTGISQLPPQITDDLVIIKNPTGKQKFTVNDEENKTFLLLFMDSADISGEFIVEIKGENAKVKILGVIIGSGDQKIRFHTVQDHSGKSSISDLLIKSVLFDAARLSYSGLINIGIGAQKSNAYQKNQNILMSPKSWADSRPYLEIKANDVRCTHGATVGKIDSEQLYYLSARGLNKTVAEKLILEGFFNEIMSYVSDENMRKRITKEINLKLDNNLRG